MSLTPEDIRESFTKIKAYHKNFVFNGDTVGAWLAAMNRLGASKQEIRDAIVDHAMSEDGRFEPKVAHIVFYIRKRRGVI